MLHDMRDDNRILKHMTKYTFLSYEQNEYDHSPKKKKNLRILKPLTWCYCEWMMWNDIIGCFTFI